MPRRFALRVLCLVLLFAARAAFAGDVKVDFNTDLDFGRYKTYAWLARKVAVSQGNLTSDYADAIVKSNVNQQLAAKGLKEVPVDNNPDLLISWFGVVRTTDSSVAMPVVNVAEVPWGPYDPYWGGTWWGISYTIVSTSYKRGHIVLDLLDPKIKAPAWRTYLQMDIPRMSQIKGRVAKLFEEAFRKFPPSPKDVQEMKAERAKMEAKLKSEAPAKPN